MLKIAFYIAAAVSPFAALGVAGYHDSQQTTRTYRVGHMFGGGMGVIATTKGDWGIYNDEEVVGLYSYGEPKVIGFNCGDYDKTLIAMEEDLLPECERVEVITYPKNEASWAN